MTRRGFVAITMLALGAACPAAAEVPTATDFAACNTKAAEDAKADGASASPRTDLPKDATEIPRDARATSAAPGALSGTRDPSGRTLSSDKDPQIEGLAADRAGDKVYVAAYRACMRQRGF